MSGKEPDIRIGGTPRADLLPPEIRNIQRDRRRMRYLIYAIVAVAAVVVVGNVYAFGQAFVSQALLTQEQAKTDDLLAQQVKYSEARTVNRQLEATVAARKQGISTEIDWKAYLAEVSATLPDGVSLTTIDIDSVSPVDVLPEAEQPLQTGWIATLTINARSVTVPDVETWLNDLKSLTGFAGVAPPVNVTGSVDAGYTVAIQVHVNSDAYTLRFQDAKEEK